MSQPLEVPVGSEAASTTSDENKTTTALETKTGVLSYKQQLKQDAMLWAEFLYAEYKREKALKGKT